VRVTGVRKEERETLTSTRFSLFDVGVGWDTITTRDSNCNKDRFV
jgi:hypothetical protein